MIGQENDEDCDGLVDEENCNDTVPVDSGTGLVCRPIHLRC